MKKGCFLSVIITLTIILIAVFYGIKYYGDDILKIGKTKAVSLFKVKLNDDFEKLDKSQFGDSLKIEIEKYLSRADTMKFDEQAIEKFGEIADNIDVILRDSKIDSAEFQFIKNVLKNNER